MVMMLEGHTINVDIMVKNITTKLVMRDQKGPQSAKQTNKEERLMRMDMLDDVINNKF
jgi:hypothetical protein